MFRTAFGLISFVLELITAWKVFEKYGEPGWKGLIPIYSDYVEYGKVWNANIGLLYVICYLISCCNADGILAILVWAASFVMAILGFLFAFKKARAFGKSGLFAILLWIFPFIGNLIIGFDDRCSYIGSNS